MKKKREKPRGLLWMPHASHSLLRLVAGWHDVRIGTNTRSDDNRRKRSSFLHALLVSEAEAMLEEAEAAGDTEKVERIRNRIAASERAMAVSYAEPADAERMVAEDEAAEEAAGREVPAHEPEPTPADPAASETEPVRRRIVVRRKVGERAASAPARAASERLNTA